MWSLSIHEKIYFCRSKFSDRLHFFYLSRFSTSVDGDIDKHRDKEREKKERQEREFQLNKMGKRKVF
jgi:hypothetical protein